MKPRRRLSAPVGTTGAPFLHRSRACPKTSIRRISALIVGVGGLCVAISAVALAQPTAAGTNAADREQVTAIVNGMEKAWNEHDMRALANLFHEDGIWVLWTGQVWKGRTAIEVGHADVHRTVFRNSVQRKRIEELTFTGPETAVIRSFDTLTGDERSPDKVVRSRKILVVTKRDGIWKIAWGQNTRLADLTPD